MRAVRQARPSFEGAVRAVILRLRPGEIATYGEIAEEAGYPGAGRAVGRILATSEGLPWWRVVTSTGRLVPGHEKEHAERLRSEDVPVSGGRVSGRRRRGAAPTVPTMPSGRR